MGSSTRALAEAVSRAIVDWTDDQLLLSDHRAMHLNDLLFLKRVLRDGLEPYEERLRELGLTDRERVLDAGCGFGQWSLVLSTLNASVTSIDNSESRISFVKMASDLCELRNLKALPAELEETGLPEGSFDLIFCYSVLYLTNVPKCLTELVRLLKPGGQIYLATNAPGWYLKSLLEPRFETPDYSPADVARDAFHQLSVLSTGGSWVPGKAWMLTSSALRGLLEQVGLRIVYIGPEGSYPKLTEKRYVSPYEAEYLGLEVVLEAIAEKPL